MIELIVIIFERDTIHKNTVERVVERVIDVIAGLSLLETFGHNSGEEITRLGGEVSARFSNNSVTERIITGILQVRDELFVKITRRITTTEIKNFHGMTILSANFNAFSSHIDGLQERAGTILTGTTVEVNTVETDTQFLSNILENFVGIFKGSNVITKFIGEDSGELLRVIFSNGNTPEDLHVGGDSLNLDDFINGISSSVKNIVLSSVEDILFFLNRIGVNHVGSRDTHFQTLSDFTLGGNI